MKSKEAVIDGPCRVVLTPEPLSPRVSSLHKLGAKNIERVSSREETSL